ncbi:DNA translocase FtsK [Mycoplasmatota bacterium]|nr:DNA translocase FtsK [Mycoplasmatota bacterium]
MFSKKERNSDEQPQWLLDQIDVINATLQQFGIEGEVKSSKKGPTVTRYEIALEPGVNVKRISNISDNLMMSLASKSLRIEAPIPGKPYVGLEVPNVTPEIVAFGNVISNPKFYNDKEHPLKVALGVDIDGEDIFVDIQSMPHGLIAGATNSGKSVCVNTILVSLLLKNSPEDLKLILIDPKMVELTPYNDLPHLITPVITDAKMAAQALNWAVTEMDKRYQKFAKSRSRDIKSYNHNVKRGLVDSKKMPYIVIIIDELADLMMVAPHDVEDAIQRITQKARAAGIHLLVATQRPTTDVVKGTIKSNIPARIAFRVASFVDSTTILDGAGAETLLGKGDMLLKKDDRAHRLQGAYIPDDEIYKVTDFIRANQKAEYVFEHEELKQQVEMKEVASDDLFEDVAYFVVENQNASINSIQKQFEIGFNRAQKIVEMLEYYQIVSESQGTKAREVLVSLMELKEILGHES